jgi:hypothetical protein
MFFIGADIGRSFIDGVEKARNANWDDLMKHFQVLDGQMGNMGTFYDLQARERYQPGLLADASAWSDLMVNQGYAPRLWQAQMDDKLNMYQMNPLMRAINAGGGFQIPHPGAVGGPSGGQAAAVSQAQARNQGQRQAAAPTQAQYLPRPPVDYILFDNLEGVRKRANEFNNKFGHYSSDYTGPNYTGPNYTGFNYNWWR